jgi:hypothetical protein
MNNFDHIPDDVLQAALLLALKQIREERADVNWVPRFHNGRELFEERLSARLAGGFSGDLDHVSAAP